jgi:hypothetical protein
MRLRELRNEWIGELGVQNIDMINSEILKLS